MGQDLNLLDKPNGVFVTTETDLIMRVFTQDVGGHLGDVVGSSGNIFLMTAVLP
jgi:hypothetical protein